MTKLIRNCIPIAEKGAANGVATLDGSQKIPASQLPTSVREYKGNWNAQTNTPALSSGTGTNGDTYRVSVSGNTNLDGVSDWQEGDELTFNGQSNVWEKSPYTEDSDRVINNSNVPGSNVTEALDNLETGKANSSHTHTESQITDLDKYTQSEVDNLLSQKEDSFTKNTAFNKDFGSTTGTVCDGADPRLSDPRPPTAHTHTLSQVTDAGAVAGLNSIGTSAIDNNAVTNTKAADMGPWTIKGRNNSATGNPQDIASGNLTTKTPAAGDFALGFASSGQLRKFDLSSLIGGGGSSGASLLASFPSASITNGTASANTVYAIRFLCPADIAVSEMGFFVTSVGNDNCVFGIYDDNETLIGTTGWNPTGGYSVGDFVFEPLLSTVNLVGGNIYWLALKGGIGTINFGTQGVFTNASIARSRFFSGTTLPATLGGSATSLGSYIHIKA